ncbi:hypothetical protein [Actinomadura sp. WMMB 499]|uniref:hypothetical protein n=1 Tax=Actinomadura sp. WMMB 499 TaxID=1219491 RepID=UPI0012483503|nr:hypothetical protein [Actinomadura sp. WMMB 499]QFG23115.1 hypothetical protein F7P10_20300 [Actinomadura sp. WMMB 499]
MSIRRRPQDGVYTGYERARQAATQGAAVCRRQATMAADRIMPAASERVLVARGWSAPRLRRAARYVETGLAPRVSTFMNDMAHKVEPPRRNRPSTAMVMTMTGAALAAGAAGVVMTRRGAIREMAGRSEEEGEATSADSMTVSGADADGRVHSPH